MNENSVDWNKYDDLMNEIDDCELKSLECPTHDCQQTEWDRILTGLDEKIERLIESIDCKLVDWNFFDKSCGVINKIYILNVNKRSDGKNIQLVLRIINPHLFWKKTRVSNEVAIMSYLKLNTTIPVPTIVSFSCDETTSLLGCEYILMEKMAGVILSELTDKVTADELHETVIDQMIDYFRQLRFIRPVQMEPDKIGSFDLSLKLTNYNQDGPPVPVCDNYFQFVDFQLAWASREAKKLKKYQSLAESIENTRRDLNQVVTSNKHLNNLNFDDEMTVFHGDLNASNILIDPTTNVITGILDWDFSMHGFDCAELGFFEYWFEDEQNRLRIKQRIERKLNSEPYVWFKPQVGLKFRSYLYNLVGNCNQLGFYTSSWWKSDQNKDLGVRIHIDHHARLVVEMLKNLPVILEELKTFKK